MGLQDSKTIPLFEIEAMGVNRGKADRFGLPVELAVMRHDLHHPVSVASQ